MIAELLDYLVASTPPSQAWTLVVLVLAFFLIGVAPAIWLKPNWAGILIGLLTLALAYVVDFVVSFGLVIGINADLDRLPPVVELFIFAYVALGWVVVGVAGGLMRRHRAVLRQIFCRTPDVARAALRFAYARRAAATGAVARAALAAGALLVMPYLAVVASLHAPSVAYAVLQLGVLALPLVLPAFIARGKPLNAWTLGLALNLTLFLWRSQDLRPPAPPGEPLSLTDLDGGAFLLIFLPTMLAVPGTAARWLWIGARRGSGGTSG